MQRLSIFLITVVAGSCFAQFEVGQQLHQKIWGVSIVEPSEYEKAYKASMASGETLLVQLGATWCEPCQRQEKIIRAMDLKNVNYAYVDIDAEKGLAKALNGGQKPSQVPTLIIYKKVGDNWTKVKLIGVRKPAELLKQL